MAFAMMKTITFGVTMMEEIAVTMAIQKVTKLAKIANALQMVAN